MQNEILQEIWQTRKEIEDQEGGDLKRVFEKMKKKTAESNRRHYSGAIRTREASGNS